MNHSTSSSDDLFMEYKRFLAKHRVGARLSDEAPGGSMIIPYDEEGEFDIEKAEAMIRQLESVRRYSTFETIGTEPRADWLVRLGTVASRRGPYLAPMIRSLQGVLDRRIADVERGLDRLGRRLHFRCYIGPFPTGDLNAMSLRIPSGALILLNTGLMNLVFTVLKIHVLSQRIGPGKKERVLISERQVTLLLAEALNAYLYGAGAWMTWQIPQLDARRSNLIAPTLGICEDFVLAHEYGHLLAGDRDQPDYLTAPVQAPVPDLAIPTASQQAEFAADQLAVETVWAAIVGDAVPSPYEERTLFAGLLLFFLLDTVVRAADVRLRATSPALVVETHPPPQERSQRIATWLASHQRHETSFSLWESFEDWFNHYTPGAINEIEVVNQTVVRSKEPWWRM
jgi:hypothetical protein